MNFHQGVLNDPCDPSVYTALLNQKGGNLASDLYFKFNWASKQLHNIFLFLIFSTATRYWIPTNRQGTSFIVHKFIGQYLNFENGMMNLLVIQGLKH